MKRSIIPAILLMLTIAAVLVLVLRKNEKVPADVLPVNPPAPVATNITVVPPMNLPAGWKDFAKLKQGEQLNRVTEAMENHTLPSDVLKFFEGEIFNRNYWPVTRNNMANALVWQEEPNPRLHELFIKMLEDTTEDPVWRDYCLQFLSECMKSTSDPEAVKEVLSRYSQGKDGLAGTAIVNLAYQEGEGRIQTDETFSRQIEAQLADPDVAVPTRMSILGVIGKRKDTRLLPAVRSYAASTNDGMRRCAIAALGQIGTAEDLPLIQKGLSDPNRAVQMAAQTAKSRLNARLLSTPAKKEHE